MTEYRPSKWIEEHHKPTLEEGKLMSSNREESNCKELNNKKND